VEGKNNPCQIFWQAKKSHSADRNWSITLNKSTTADIIVMDKLLKPALMRLSIES
jgi:hypothetical protein